METETIDKLFLELSQITQAKTAKEIALLREILDLRYLLAKMACPATLYTDDGELSDASVQPFIDFKRDSPAQIRLKLQTRAIDAAMKPATEPT